MHIGIDAFILTWKTQKTAGFGLYGRNASYQICNKNLLPFFANWRFKPFTYCKIAQQQEKR